MVKVLSVERRYGVSFQYKRVFVDAIISESIGEDNDDWGLEIEYVKLSNGKTYSDEFELPENLRDAIWNYFDKNR